VQEEIESAFRAAGVAYRGEDWAFFERLRHLVLDANAVMNLTRITEAAEFHGKHVLDSLLPFHAVEALASLGEGLRVADLGSGAGFPGLVLARMHPSWRVTLLERTIKKAAFLERTASSLSLHNVDVIAKDARESGLQRACGLVTARAVGRLAEVTRIAGPLLAPKGMLLHYKGGGLDATELAEGEGAARRLRLVQRAPVAYLLPPDLARVAVVTVNPPRRRKRGEEPPPS